MGNKAERCLTLSYLSVLKHKLDVQEPEEADLSHNKRFSVH